MSTKKRKPLGSAIEEFVFSTQEAALPPTALEVVSSATAPQASQTAEKPLTPITSFALLSIATLPQPEVSGPEPVSTQSKEPSLTSKLQALNKEVTVRFTVDMFVGRAPQTVDVGSLRQGARKRTRVQMLLEDGLKEEV